MCSQWGDPEMYALPTEPARSPPVNSISEVSSECLQIAMHVSYILPDSNSYMLN